MRNDQFGRSWDRMRIIMSQESEGGKAGFPADLSWDPPTEGIETNSGGVVIIEIAGVEHGGRKANKCEGQRQYHQIEIRFGRFSRDIDLPVPVDPSEISARYENGILEVRLKKLDMSKRIRKVEIK